MLLGTASVSTATRVQHQAFEQPSNFYQDVTVRSDGSNCLYFVRSLLVGMSRSGSL